MGKAHWSRLAIIVLMGLAIVIVGCPKAIEREGGAQLRVLMTISPAWALYPMMPG